MGFLKILGQENKLGQFGVIIFLVGIGIVIGMV